MNTIEECIKQAGWGRRKAMKKQIDLIESQLLNGEKLLGVAISKPNPTEQLYVTDKRIIVHKIEGMLSNTKKEIPLSSISSVNVETKLTGGKIKIIASGNSADVENIPLHLLQEIKNIIDELTLNN